MEGLERWQNNQMKKMGIGRLGLIFFMIGGMLFVVLRSGQATYLVIQVVLLFSALFFGYRFGPGAGAIAGSISGIMLSLVSGEAAQIGILCLLGIFSGAFRSLGRMASVTACAAAAFGVGIVYSPAILFQTMESVLAVGVVFLLLPEKLTCPQKQNLLKEDCGFNEQESIPVWQAAVEDMAGEGLPALAQTFSQLSSMYREEDVAKDPFETDWRMRYLELRQLLSEQFFECAQMLLETVGQMQEKEELSGAVRENLEKKLLWAGVEAKRIYGGNLLIDMEEQHPVQEIAIDENLSELKEAMKTGQKEQVDQILYDIETAIRQALMEKSRACMYLQQVIRTMDNACEDVSADMDRIREGRDELLRQVTDQKFFEDACKVVQKHTDRIFAILSEMNTSSSERQARLAIDYIQKNYMEPNLSLNSICSYLNISTSYFSTIFKDETGETFTEALIRTRMEKAKELLENTTMKNYEIAEKVGFSDPHYFGISFKKMTGYTPTEYAREKRK